MRILWLQLHRRSAVDLSAKMHHLLSNFCITCTMTSSDKIQTVSFSVCLKPEVCVKFRSKPDSNKHSVVGIQGNHKVEKVDLKMHILDQIWIICTSDKLKMPIFILCLLYICYWQVLFFFPILTWCNNLQNDHNTLRFLDYWLNQLFLFYILL